MSQREQLSDLLSIDLEVINKLFNEGLLDPRGLRVFLIKAEFKAMKEANPDLTDYKITKELGYKHDLSKSTVYKWVTNYG
jgi:hypothetical protein